MEILKLCMDLGVSGARELPVENLVFAPELRELCERNACGRYGRNYTCPPLAGGVEELIAKVKSFSRAVIWQNIYALEDSFDFEGMMEAQKKHNGMTREIARRVYAALGRGSALVLGAGGCSLCDKCAVQTDEPCRDSGNALSSLEAHGILVSKTCEALGLNYINGKDTVTYFSGVFW